MSELVEYADRANRICVDRLEDVYTHVDEFEIGCVNDQGVGWSFHSEVLDNDFLWKPAENREYTVAFPPAVNTLTGIAVYWLGAGYSVWLDDPITEQRFPVVL